MKKTIWCATYLVRKNNGGMYVELVFTYIDTEEHADKLMCSVLKAKPEVTHITPVSIHPLDRTTIFKGDASVYEVARALANFGFAYIHADRTRPSALFELRKILHRR